MIVYEALNKVNGKVYVGLTTNTLAYRKSSHERSAKAGSNMHFHKALRKYGTEAFEWDIVMVCVDRESLYKAEKLCISLYEPWQYYNKSLGGEHAAFGMKHTAKTKELCREYSNKFWEGKRGYDIYPREAFLCEYYKEAWDKYKIPKTTWYRNKPKALASL